MDTTRIVQELMKIHEEIERECGNSPPPITPSTCPLEDLRGFDTLLAPNVVRTLARRLGIDLPKGTKVQNVYCSSDGKRKLSIAEVAERFRQIYVKEDVGS